MFFCARLAPVGPRNTNVYGLPVGYIIDVWIADRASLACGNQAAGLYDTARLANGVCGVLKQLVRMGHVEGGI